MNHKLILFTVFLLLVSFTSCSVFAEIDFDSGPLHEKPLDEREQEDRFTEEIWTYAIILVIIFIIIRLAFSVIKKRMKPKKD